MIRFTIGICLFSIFLATHSCKQTQNEPSSESQSFQTEVENSIEKLSHLWYPTVVDSLHGGYWSDFNFRWEKEGKQHKMLVSQARHIWSAATLAEYFDDPFYNRIAQHGYEFLRDVMWDHEHGGFHTLFGFEGDSLKLLSNGKSAYGNSFAIYGLATYYKSSKDTSALALAKKTFDWLDKHSRDSVYGGYFDVLAADGSWLLDHEGKNTEYDNFIRKDWKDQNSSIHLLESFTALYEVWPDPLVRKRLEELLILVRDTITTDKGYLSLHLERDWSPVSFKDSSETFRKQNFYLDHVSFGHDVETAFLLLEASHRLGLENDSITSRKAKKMVDHAIEWGWDEQKGGFFDGGYYHADGTRTIENDAKVWWAEAEALNSLLLMSKLHPEEKNYAALFERQWQYINKNLVDPTYGGWYGEGLDTHPEAASGPKAQIWKVNYHTLRSLINVDKMLKGTFELLPEHR